MYATARLAIFAVLIGLLYLAGLRSFPLVFVALVVSLPVSLVALRRQRATFTDEVERRVGESKDRRARLRAALRGDDEQA